MRTAPNPPALPRMTRWYDPVQLMRTGVDVFAAALFGRHADHRLLESLAQGTDGFFDYTRPIRRDATGAPRMNAATHAFESEPDRTTEEIWIDYIADAGDGWNSTYAVAYHAAHPAFGFTATDGRPIPRGDILVFGGDEVYPVASRDAYEQRLLRPFATALRNCDGPPHVFAIPGNHDWYDSLVSFTRQFVSRRWLGGWFAPQTRSYFALKLPHRWWLVGADVQLGADIDGPQVEYFKKIAESEMRPGDHVILCVAQPHWISERLYRGYDRFYSQSNLAYLEKRVLARQKVVVMLAGDLHHYRHHAAADGTRRIVAGGGGAFLYPTHFGRLSRWNVRHLDDARLEDVPSDDATAAGDRERTRIYDLQDEYPPAEVSRRLCWRNLLFPVRNASFGLFTALLYVLLCWSVRAPLETVPFAVCHLGEAFESVARATVASPTGTFMVLVAIAGMVVFTDVHSRWYRVIGGGLHAGAHLFAALLIGWGTARVCHIRHPLEENSAAGLLLGTGMSFGLAWVIGSIIMGLYLLVSLNVFGFHRNEAFSALRCEDWKNFLKLHLDRRGDLTIYPIGIDRVPRRWAAVGSPGPGKPEMVPRTGGDSRCTPHLIHPPIRLAGPGAAAAAGKAGRA
jgi:3',5'-cyclic AMP phosphodiesterase CpdA